MDDQLKKDECRASPLEDLFRPWELVGEARRDCQPHRAGLLLWLARISLLAGGLSFVCLPFGLIGLALALGTRRLARRDLESIFAGEMDQYGYAPTEKARADSNVAVVVSLLGSLFWLVLLALFSVLAVRHVSNLEGP
jgi:hypothetical protein